MVEVMLVHLHSMHKMEQPILAEVLGVVVLKHLFQGLRLAVQVVQVSLSLKKLQDF